MSLAFEQSNGSDDKLQTPDEAYLLTAWFADPSKQLDEPMPPLSPLTLQRLDGLIMEEHAADFQMAMTNLFAIKDENLREATYLYMCGYSDTDLALIVPDVPLSKIKVIVESWVGIEIGQPESHTAYGESESTREVVELQTSRGLGRIATTKTASSRVSRRQIHQDPDFRFDDEENGERNGEPVDELDLQVPASDPVALYMKSMGKTALLKAEEEVELAKRIEVGLYAQQIIDASKRGEIIDGVIPRDMTKSESRDLLFLVRDGVRAKHHLLEANLRLVVSIAKRYTGRGMPLLDLIQEGNLGLVRGMEKFDYTKGYKFSTYATWWIRQAVTRGLSDQARTIRLPVHFVEKVNKLAHKKREMMQDLGRNPTYEELAAEMNMPVDKVHDLEKHSKTPISLDKPIGDDDSQLGDYIADTTINVERSVVMGDRDSMIAGLVAVLPGDMQRIARLRFGMEDGREYTYDELSAHRGVTRERIRQIILHEITPRLRVLGSKMGLDQFAETAVDDESPSVSLHDMVQDAIRGLDNSRQQQYMTAWLGLSNGKPLTTEQIASKYKVSPRSVGIAISNAKRAIERLLPQETTLFTDV